MAWRIHQQVLHGEIDNRIRGRVTGKIWMQGWEEPLLLDLEGNAWRDLAGHRMTFTRTASGTETEEENLPDLEGLAPCQHGTVGDMTASRKVKVPECPIEEIRKYTKAGLPFPFHWANCLYLEWFSETNGRVVLESTEFDITLDPEAAWPLSEQEETAQREANEQALTGFMDDLADAPPAQSGEEDLLRDEDAGKPLSQEEATADADTARMDLLLDRVHYRMEREGLNPEEFDRIYEEERERLRRERGEPEPEPLTPEEEAERADWIEEMNAIAQEALEEFEAEAGKGLPERKDHPLVTRCRDLSVHLHQTADDHGWIKEGETHEHPVHEVINGVMIASAKLGGALNQVQDEEWPPAPLFAGDTLVRLKKAREALKDALLGLQSSDEQNLAAPEWRSSTRREVEAILHEVRRLIQEVRSTLE